MTERTTSAEDGAQGRGDRGGHAPQRPTQLPGGSWWAAVKRTVREFQVDNLSDRAAALTYYSVLSIFPALLVVNRPGPVLVETLAVGFRPRRPVPVDGGRRLPVLPVEGRRSGCGVGSGCTNRSRRGWPARPPRGCARDRGDRSARSCTARWSTRPGCCHSCHRHCRPRGRRRSRPGVRCTESRGVLPRFKGSSQHPEQRGVDGTTTGLGC
jgi:hypothetical protein